MEHLLRVIDGAIELTDATRQLRCLRSARRVWDAHHMRGRGKALGIKISQVLFMRADRVIE